MHSHHGATKDPFDSRHLSCYNPTAFARTEDEQSRNRDWLHDRLAMCDGAAEKGNTVTSTSKASSKTQGIALALLALLIVFHLVNNLVWRMSNEVVFAMDRMFHQVTSLAYYDILRESVNLRTLFAALTWSDYYPPLVHLTAAAFYKLFGVSMDVAALSNSIYLVLFLLAVYGIGERLRGPWTGLLSAFILSTFPIIFSMSRYLYVDFALTSMVAVNVCLLLRSDHFEHKGYALLYGLSLGLGMLAKWTFIAFTIAPLLVVLASSGVLRSAWQAVQPSAWRGRRFLLATLLGLGLTALWFVPNVQATAALPLGYALVPLSWLFWTLTAYFCLAPSGRGANLLGALGLGLCVASGWYLTKINFLGTFWLNAYGKPTGRTWGFGSYLDFLYREQLSPVYAVILVVAVAGLIWSRWRRTRSLRATFALGVDGWALVLWALLPFFVFSSQVSIIHSRYIMPLLPPLGIAIALWLNQLHPRWVRLLLIGLIVVGALFQFSALSFDALAGVQEQVPLLAEGLSIQLPSSGQTDSGYWVVPDILEYIDEQRGSAPASLGVLVNSPQVNSKHFIYLAYAEHPQVQIQELATIGLAQPAYPRLFENDFILLIDPAPDYPRRPDTEATIKRLLETPDDTFHRVYDLVQNYPLPGGRRLQLYQRRFGPPPSEDLAYSEALMADLVKVAQPEDAVIVMPPEEIYALARYGDGSLSFYPLPAEPGPLSEGDLTALEQLGAEHSRLWLVHDPLQQDDPTGLLNGWLASHFYRADDTWYGPMELVLYAPGTAADRDIPQKPSEAVWDNGITLQGYRLLDGAVPLGQILRLELVWQPTEAVPERNKVFVHLLSPDGQVVAQRDSEPVAGTQPTPTWQPGEPVADRYGLWLPEGTPPGDYTLVVGFYHPDTGERVPACCPAGDAIPLARVRIEGDSARIFDATGN
jgi:4-amino-4-deoxy-L-arabinose transferase-like glycosyltransferase